MTQRPNWGRLAIFSLITTLLIAIVLFFVLDESRWVAWAVLGLGLFDAAFLALVMPRLTGAEDDVPIQDGDWGVAPPSEPAEAPAPEAVDPLDD
jgi:hypothetical protein